jgi:hypothetical protein
MGDRVVVGFRSDSLHTKERTLFLYSHWGGSSMRTDLALALLHAKPRWGDPDYAMRITISQLIGEDWMRDTGYGLSVGEYCMPDYDLVPVVNWQRKQVEFYDSSTYEKQGHITFTDYIDGHVQLVPVGREMAV